MSEETKKILKDKTHIELNSATKLEILDSIVGESEVKKTKLFQKFFLPAGLVATFLVALIFFQSRPAVDSYADIDTYMKNYFERESVLDEMYSETVVYSDLQIEYGE